MTAAKIRDLAATVPKAEPRCRLSDEASVILRTRLRGGLVEIRFEGGGIGFRCEQIARLKEYLDLLLQADIEEHELPGVLTEASSHEPDPVALDEGIR